MDKRAYTNTPVPVEKSHGQIRQLLAKHSVKAIRFTSFPSYALLEYVREVQKGQFIPYQIQIVPKFSSYKSGAGGVDQAEKQVWRVAYWWLKSKLEAIEFGLVEFEQEFLPYMLLQDSEGRSVPAAQIFFARLANALGPPTDDPFGGLRPALPPKRDEEA